jgi:hypothetical protein
MRKLLRVEVVDVQSGKEVSVYAVSLIPAPSFVGKFPLNMSSFFRIIKKIFTRIKTNIKYFLFICFYTYLFRSVDRKF